MSIVDIFFYFTKRITNVCSPRTARNMQRGKKIFRRARRNRYCWSGSYHSALFDKIIAEFKLYIYRKHTYAPSIKTIRVLIKTRPAVSKGRIKIKIRTSSNDKEEIDVFTLCV